MNRILLYCLGLGLFLTVPNSCVTKKKKSETGAVGKFYHNTTAYYNGYWNANEILKESMKTLRAANTDDYNKILEVEDFIAVDNPKMVKGEMDKIIEKVTTVAQLHEPSDWVDDCYVMMAKAQYLKQEYETTEETLEYFQEDFNPANPYGRNYKSRKPTGKAAKRAKEDENKAKAEVREKEKEEKDEARKKEELKNEQLALKKEEEKIRDAERAASSKAKEEEKKIKEAERAASSKAKEEEKKIKEADRKAVAKTKAEQKKDQDKERERAKKEKEKLRKENAKNRKKGIPTKKSSTTPVKSQPTETKEPTLKEESEIKVKSDEVPLIKDQVKPKTETTDTQVVVKKQVPKKAIPVKVKKQDVKKEEKEVAETVTPPKVKKPEEDKTAYSEGLLWLAKTYIKRENWFAAEMLLQKLDKSAVSDEIKSDLPATHANLYIKQKKYGDALVKLDQAIEEEGDKQLKARYAFIAGQISQEGKQNPKALEYFAMAKKYARNPKMEFMADLAEAKNGIITGSRTKESVVSDLKKMLNEVKNSDVKDQIYFTIAEIEVSQNNADLAIANFKNSIANNTANQKLKAESYFQIADLNYNLEKYLGAAAYYDTTLTLLPSSDPRYSKVQKLVSNLKEIAANIETISYQDTLLYFVSLNDDEKKKIIPPWLERNKKQNKTVGSGNIVKKQLFENTALDFGNSTFFAYNKNSKTRGKEEFEKLWERRPLEDDWRRSNKVSSGIVENAEKKVDETDGSDQKFDKEEYEKFLRELPNNPIKKQEVQERIIISMFNLGKLFRDKIENFAKSASTLEGMHKRFGPTPHEMDSYFYLYLDYIDMGNKTKAEEYKSELLKKYPQSSYSSILSDPDYFNKANSKVSKADDFYRSVYSLYEKREFNDALNFLDKASDAIGENHNYHAKIALLKAMCMGGRDGKDAYIKGLNDVLTNHPNTPEQSKAREIMRFLGGDQTAFATVQDVDKIYQRDPGTTHYVAVVTYNLEESQYVNFKVAVSEYNKKNFKTDRLQMGDASLNIELNSQIILIRKFENENKALEYYRRTKRDAEEFSGKANYTYDVLVISQANYRKMLSERTSTTYRAFFESNILQASDK